MKKTAATIVSNVSHGIAVLFRRFGKGGIGEISAPSDF